MSQKLKKIKGLGCSLYSSHLYLFTENISNWFEIYYGFWKKARGTNPNDLAVASF